MNQDINYCRGKLVGAAYTYLGLQATEQRFMAKEDLERHMRNLTKLPLPELTHAQTEVIAKLLVLCAEGYMP